MHRNFAESTTSSCHLAMHGLASTQELYVHGTDMCFSDPNYEGRPKMLSPENLSRGLPRDMTVQSLHTLNTYCNT